VKFKELLEDWQRNASEVHTSTECGCLWMTLRGCMRWRSCFPGGLEIN
jgi:hypothetical protein